MDLQMTKEQFVQLMKALATVRQPATLIPQSSFIQCAARYDGIRERIEVEKFLLTITLYKDIEGITDDNALKSLPLLLEGEAFTWWQGVHQQVTSWRTAVEMLRTEFIPKKPAHEIYSELFSNMQNPADPTESFVARKRKLLAELPYLLLENVQLDMVYSLLSLDIREKIPRNSISTFSDLVNTARHFERIEKEIEENRREEDFLQKRRRRQKRRCAYCRMRGHRFYQCRRRPNEEYAEPTSTLRCESCGNPAYIQGECSVCYHIPPNSEDCESVVEVDYITDHPEGDHCVVGNIPYFEGSREV